MKIFIINKKIIFFICLLTLLVLIVFYTFYKSFSLAAELSQDSFLSNASKEKFNNLCNCNEKNVYLTFDDGPTTKATNKVLDILKENNVKSTFFVVGKHVKENPDIIKREYDEGHYIANHGYSHNNKKLYQSIDSFLQEVKNTDLEIGKAIGIDNYCSHVFRFPNGFMSPNNKTMKKKAAAALESINYIYVDWNCLNRDSEKRYSSYQLMNNLKKSSKNKGTLIVLMHDTSDVNDTPSILKDSINYFKSQGYEFKNFYDLL